MKRVNQILNHPGFRRAVAEIEEAESQRIYCGHGLDHLLAVARLAMLIAGEEQLQVPTEQIYAAALLHDVGRGREYQEGTDHEEAALKLADPILMDCGYNKEERDEILRAIQQHRSSWKGQRTTLGALLFRADKQSRPCFFCVAAESCNWPEEKRNSKLIR